MVLIRSFHSSQNFICDSNIQLIHQLPRHHPRFLPTDPHTPFTPIAVSTPERQQAASIIGKLLEPVGVIAKRLAIWSIGEATAVFAEKFRISILT
tara:strand:- start:4435 stop:4719 length:285 start_codon:yes stop_codon:yes gene_type:complete